MKKIIPILLLALTVTLFSQDDKEIADGWKINAFAHLIGQMDGKDFLHDTHPYFFTTSKIRLGVEKEIEDIVRFRVDFQDSRLLGTGFIGTAQSVDIMQGYVEFLKVFNLPLSIQAGRFQMQYGSERFIGRSLWHYQERAFDGARAIYNDDGFNADIFYIIHTNSADYLLKVFPGQYGYPAPDDEGYRMYGFWTEKSFAKHQIGLFGFNEDDNKTDLSRYTAGLTYAGSFGKLALEGEFAYQGGTRVMKKTVGEETISTEQDISAYLASAKATMALKPVKIHAGVDLVSGTSPDDPADEFHTFVNYPASKHKFLGLMDYFLVTTKGTGNLGVNDFYGGIARPLFKDMNAMLTYHYFLANQENANGNSDFGHEIDLVLKYSLTKSIFVHFGGGLFLPGEAMKQLYMLEQKERGDPSFWSYTMIFVKL